MRINLRLVLTFLAIVVSATLWAAVQQEIRISGTVISDGEPLPGVSVQIKGETTGNGGTAGQRAEHDKCHFRV